MLIKFPKYKVGDKVYTFLNSYTIHLVVITGYYLSESGEYIYSAEIEGEDEYEYVDIKEDLIDKSITRLNNKYHKRYNQR